VSLPVAVIGAGGWGTALAVILAKAERCVSLWVHEPNLAAIMAETRENPVYLPSVQIPESVQIRNTMEEVVAGSRIVIMAVPSHVFRGVVQRVTPFVKPDTIFVSATKGIETQTLMRMSQVIGHVLETNDEERIAVISGPTFAPEVARGVPTALVVASKSESLRLLLQRELSMPRFRLYTNSDTIGVEMGAATKNIIAIAAGVADGLGLGSNAVAALVTRGLVEITRLAVACGGRRETLSGLAGLGDLILTSYGQLSRNRSVGIALGQGRQIGEITAGMRSVAEGIRTTESTVTLARKFRVEMPIAERMYSVMYEGLRVNDAIQDLMERKLKEE
jgi:glycerol-3-phosphate dehydrogenase (NAD(P)+)